MGWNIVDTSGLNPSLACVTQYLIIKFVQMAINAATVVGQIDQGRLVKLTKVG